MGRGEYLEGVGRSISEVDEDVLLGGGVRWMGGD